ncbi:DUF3263 domain-containing protein [Herbiconiux solani]|uniref:DUF3263 domain-containing protein n=1 Tax=Herbiconiux solani TaxID=661329 RepID=UPI000825F95A|nr:DUF3263 domain-containing protein [Herbiconiux solani]
MLTAHESAILAFEEKWIDQPLAGREMAVQRVLGMKHTQYLQALHRLLDREDAIAANPQLLYRLRDRRDRRMRERATRLMRSDA